MTERHRRLALGAGAFVVVTVVVAVGYVATGTGGGPRSPTAANTAADCHGRSPPVPAGVPYAAQLVARGRTAETGVDFDGLEWRALDDVVGRSENATTAPATLNGAIELTSPVTANFTAVGASATLLPQARSAGCAPLPMLVVGARWKPNIPLPGGPGPGAPPGQSTKAAVALDRAVAATLAAGSAAVTVQFGSGAASQAASGGFDFSTAAGSLRATGELRFIGSQLYTQLEGPAAVYAAAKPWVHADMVEVEDGPPSLKQFVVQTETLNPLLAVAQLAWGTESVRVPEDAGDGSVESFDATLNLRQVLFHLGGPDEAAFQIVEIQEISGSGESGTMTAGVWLDPAGRVSRIRFTPPGAGLGTVTFNFSSYGIPVTVSPPPPGQVTDLTADLPGEVVGKGGSEVGG